VKRRFPRPEAVVAQDIAQALLCGDLGQGFIKEVHFQQAVFQQGFDLRFGNGREVVKMLLAQCLDLMTLNHSPVADEGDLSCAKTLDDFLDLRGKRLGILGITGKDLNRKGRAIGIAVIVID
jgi:hypothetical protein